MAGKSKWQDHMIQKAKGLSGLGHVLIASILLAGCSKMETEQVNLTQHNGFIIGDEDEPAPTLVVGVGDRISRLLDRNPFLRNLKIQEHDPLRLPLLRTTNVVYNDGKWHLDVGCVFTSNLDGDDRFPGVETVGLKLCNPSLNDWKSATRRAEELVKRFQAANPDAVDFSHRLRHAKESEWRPIGGNAWVLPGQRQVMSVNEADIYFAELSRLSQRDAELAGMLPGVRMGIFLGEKTIFEVGVAKQAKWGGDNLTESQRNDMHYSVTVVFTLRKDVPPPR